MEELERWNIEGMIFRAVLALTPEERAASYRLRYKEFVDGPKRRFAPENYSNGLECDRFDEYSHHLLIFRDDSPEPIGNLRLIDGARGPFFLDGKHFSGVPFALPQTVDGETVRPQSTFEAGRWHGKAIKVPGGTRVLSARLVFNAALDLSQRLGFRHWIFAIEVSAAERMREDGFRIFPIVPGIHRFLDSEVELCIMSVGSHVRRFAISPEVDV